MRELLQEIVSLQLEYDSTNTAAMQRRGALVRRTLPRELAQIGIRLRTAMGPYGDDARAQGKDNMGKMARIPWIRWHSKSRSPAPTKGWYVVYLFNPDGSGVSLCLSHGSTKFDGSGFINRSDAEAAELMAWGSDVLKTDINRIEGIRHGIALGRFPLAVGYQRTTLFSKFYPSGAIPSDADLEDDLLSFVRPLAKLYQAQDEGIEPTPPSPESLAVRETIDGFVAPLSAGSTGQGWGLPGPIRKLVERAAMKQAAQWLKAQGFKFRDVSAGDCCDFRARKDGQNWVIEVKGTTGGPGSIFLTRNEVALHRRSHPLNALVVVHGLSVSKDGTRVTGGELVAFYPWQLDEDRLSSVCYEYRLGKTG
jgi:hypothetical protein